MERKGDKLVGYLRALEFLHRKEPDSLRAILTVFNYEQDSASLQVRNFENLATLMLDGNNYDEVVRVAKRVIISQSVLTEFLSNLPGDPTTDAPPPSKK